MAGYLTRVKVVLPVNPLTCPLKKPEVPKDYAEIRSLVRLYKKTSPSPTRQSDPGAARFDWRKYAAESRRPSIKFSTSTALYTPAKPSYENIFRSDSAQHRSVIESNSGRFIY